MIRIGTRGSALALAQANWVASRLPDAELVTITNRDYYFHTKDIYAGLAWTGACSSAFLLEPFGRNTAAAVALAALQARALLCCITAASARI